MHDLCEQPQLGVPNSEDIQDVIKAIKHAKFPVLLVGMRSSSEKVTEAIRKLNQIYQLLKHSRVPVYLTVN